jgi:ribosomal protein S18 acetylase RimI-like enzyme
VRWRGELTDRKPVRVRMRRALEVERAWIEEVHVAALGPVALVGYGWTAERLRGQFRSEVDLLDCAVITVLTDDAREHRAGYISIQDRGRFWYIDAFAIAPNFQKRGVGAAAMRAILDDAGVLPVRLTVLRTNRARHLYLRLGFQITATDHLREQMEWRRAM